MSLRLLTQSSFLVLSLAAVVARGDDSQLASAREIFERYRDSVVAIQGVAQVQVSTQVDGKEKAAPDRDVTVSGVGTLVSADGVVVTALSFLDPSVSLDGRTVNTGGRRTTLDVTVNSLRELRLLLADGTEVGAGILLKDPLLDLVVLRAETEAWKKAGGDRLPWVNLKDSGEAQVLDPLLVIGQSSAAFGRAPSAARPGVMSKVTKPRLIYRPSMGQKGGPAFLHDGKLLGIAVQHVQRERVTNDLVIVPAADVAELVEQAQTKASETPAEPAAPANPSP